MPSWNPDQYLKFVNERTQPVRDLIARIASDSVQQAIDLGCGPGNSTAMLAARWPNAEITGIDSAPAMIETARRDYPRHRWLVDDITRWSRSTDARYDLVFSNAALQWVPDHGGLYPRLFDRVAPGGALALQVPMSFVAPAHDAMRDLAATPAWSPLFPAAGVREWHVETPEFYYDCIAPHAARIDLWQTEYLHVMDNAAAIVEWYKGTGLRPFLDVLPSDGDRERFLSDYLDRMRDAYPARPDGRILFPFMRFFLIAYR
jgi:trans-aconitate 2-methyltransferase